MTQQITGEVRLNAHSKSEPRQADGSEKSFVDLLRQNPAGIEEQIYLLGQPTLQDYLDFVDEKVVDGPALDHKQLTDEWRQANDYYHDLETREAGIADKAQILDLDPALKPLAEALAADPRYRFTFDSLPTQMGMVDLDRLVVFQTHVTRPFTDNLRQQLTAEPDPESLFHFCQPPETPEANVKIRRVGSKRFVFASESTDFRPHQPALLRPDQIRNHDTFGPISGVVGLVIGFGSNFMNVIRQDDRVLLHNGYHRAYALRASGITHAPCIIQTVTRHDELELAAKEQVADDPDFYFRSARPPLLKDFFDPRIRKLHQTYRTLKMIEVEFDIREFNVGA